MWHKPLKIESSLSFALNELPTEQRTWTLSSQPRDYLRENMIDLFCDATVSSNSRIDNPSDILTRLHHLYYVKWELFIDALVAGAGAASSSQQDGVQRRFQRMFQEVEQTLDWNMRSETHIDYRVVGMLSTREIWIGTWKEFQNRLTRAWQLSLGNFTFGSVQKTDSEDQADDGEIEKDNERPSSGHAGSVHDTITQQNLNRLTYIGGVFLPFSVFAGIFSMADPYGPSGKLFYIYWAVVIPVSFAIALIIYADDLRRLTIQQYLRSKGFIVAELTTITQPITNRIHSTTSLPNPHILPVPDETMSPPLAFAPEAIIRTKIPENPVRSLFKSIHDALWGHPVPKRQPIRFEEPISRIEKPTLDLNQTLGWFRAFATIFGYQPTPVVS
jgi:hypothetical protein